MICPHCLKETDDPDSDQMERRLVDVWFDAFWSAYPRHVGKAAALKAFKRAAISERIKDEIMAGLKAQLPQMARTDKSFIPHASSWLNGKRWEDSAHDPQQVPPVPCPSCSNTGVIAGYPEPDIIVLMRCSCDRGALPGKITGIYRVSTGERLGDVVCASE